MLKGSEFIEQFRKADKVLDLYQQLKDNSSSTKRDNVPGENIFKLKETIEIPKSLALEMDKDIYEWGFMGIFPSIGYIWATLDSNIYLFNYTDSKVDYFPYTELDQVITAVALITPKEDIFVEDVKHLLVLATPIEIIILALVFENNKPSLISTHLSISTDNISILKITGTKEGRIFMGGKDGNLYELVYQSNDSWFRKKCWKINHTQSLLSSCVPTFLKLSGEDPIMEVIVDNHRKLLYTLSVKSSIQVFDLGKDGEKLIRVACINDIRSACLRLWTEAQPDSSMFALKSISVTSIAESSVIHLIGITASGIRIYFTTVPRASRSKLSNETNKSAFEFRNYGPSTLDVIHIRTPPPKNEDNRRNILGGYSQIDYLCCAQGTCIFTDTIQNDNKILIICTNPSVPPNQRELKERVTFIEIDSEFAWGIVDSHPNDEKTLHCGNELFTQHVVPAPEFLFLTQEGIHKIIKLRPVDELYELLHDPQGLNSSKLELFFRHYRAEACAMCLIIICSQQENNIEHFNSYFNSSIHSVSHNILKIEGNKSHIISQKAEEAFFHFGGQPHYKEPTLTDNGIGFRPHVDLSLKFQSIGMFISRILSPIWKIKLFKVKEISKFSRNDKKQNNKDEIQCMLISSLSRIQLQEILEILLRFNNFRKNSSQFSSICQIIPKNQQTPLNTPIKQKKIQINVDGNIQAKKQEEESLRNVFMVLDRSIEAISLIQFLCYPVISGNRKKVDLTITKLLNNEITKLTFKELVCAKELNSITKLLSSLIESYSKKNYNTDYIIEQLNNCCGSYFSSANMKLHRIISELKKIEQVTMGTQSIFQKTCKEMLSIAGEVDIQPVLKYYEEFGYFTGFVQLLLTKASKIDPSDLASQFSGEDTLSEEKYEERMKCYHQIINLYNKNKHPDSRDIILSIILNNDDKLSHYALFMYYLEQNDSDVLNELLDINSPYLEDFLRDNNAELLYRFYSHRKRYGEAAGVASVLSDKSSTLETRINWLVDAINNAKAFGSGNQYGVDLHDLTDKMDVASIQLSIYKEISSLSYIDDVKKKKALGILDRSLLNLTDLYNKFASPLQLWECQLSIFHCAGHSDLKRVYQCWDKIITGTDIKDFSELEKKVLILGKKFHPSEWAFPIDHICGELELINQKLHSVSDPQIIWVIKVMMDIGVSFDTLLDVYNNLFIKYDNNIKIVIPITYLLGQWVENQISQRSHSFNSSKILKSIEQYSASLNHSKKESKIIMERLNYIQRYIKELNNTQNTYY